MDITRLEKINDFEWHIPMHKSMRAPGIIYASESLVRGLDLKVYEQLYNVASLPGIVNAAYAMPDAHWGYGFPIGCVAAFDPEQDGVISAGGVGFDISCGVRLLATGLQLNDLLPIKEKLADALYAGIPAGVGSRSRIHLNMKEMDAMLLGGAQWAVKKGYGDKRDLEFIEEKGCMAGALPEFVSDHAKERQKAEMGTLGSGNHYLEVQEVSEIYDQKIAAVLGLKKADIVISMHCGSRGLGHQIGTDYMRQMSIKAQKAGIHFVDRELVYAPLSSPIGQHYLGAMRAGVNCALANREIITHFTREIFQAVIPEADIRLIYDVSHNTCKEEMHWVNDKKTRLFVHRKGATCALGPHNPNVPNAYASIGQPVIIGGSMGTVSYVLVGTETAERKSFSSACHGAGRAMSRHQARKKWRGADIISSLAKRGILIRSISFRGVAEEAPESYKDVTEVVNAAHHAGLATKVVRLSPLICIKG